MQIELLVAGEVVHTLVIEDQPVTVGRAGANLLIVQAADVSSHHAVIWRSGNDVQVEDLGSRNGTFVNERAVHGTTVVAVGDEIRLGGATRLRLARKGPPTRSPLRLHRDGAPVAWGVDRDRFTIPDAADAWLLRDEAGAVWVVAGHADERRVRVGESFEIDGHTYSVQIDDAPTPATLEPAPATFPYLLEVHLTATRATLSEPIEGAEVTFAADNWVALLCTLGQRWLDDGPGKRRGWLDDAEVSRTIWGRDWRQYNPNHYDMLVQRLRRKIARAGFDRWFLEKRAGRSRVRVANVRLLS